MFGNVNVTPLVKAKPVRLIVAVPVFCSSMNSKSWAVNEPERRRIRIVIDFGDFQLQIGIGDDCQVVQGAPDRAVQAAGDDVRRGRQGRNRMQAGVDHGRAERSAGQARIAAVERVIDFAVGAVRIGIRDERREAGGERGASWMLNSGASEPLEPVAG